MTGRIPYAGRRATVPVVVLAWAMAASCARQEVDTLPRSALLDPDTCRTCHPDHYREWSGSMHAYAAEDPVFHAMNRMGQRDTAGALGSFCVGCHAPIAVAEGSTRDGLDLDAVPPAHRGVTCYFCHNAGQVTGTHNNPVRLADDTTMRGPLAPDPAVEAPHGRMYSEWLDSGRLESATLCGACHDIVNPHGTAVERTFAEWKDSAFASPTGGLTCAGCHMPSRPGRVAVQSRRETVVHSHAFPAVDVALTPFPQMAEQRALVQAELDTTLGATLCVEEVPGGYRLLVGLENEGAGHGWPSGSASDRRAWVEVIAEAGGERVFASGTFENGPSYDDAGDEELWLLRDCLFDDRAASTHAFWGAHAFTTNQLRPARAGEHAEAVHRVYPTGAPPPRAPDRVTVRVRLRPVGDDVLEFLVRSGDLDRAVIDRMPTFSLKGTELEWTAARARPLAAEGPQNHLRCVASGKPRLGQPARSHRTCVR